jgi:hypothetical protein
MGCSTSKEEPVVKEKAPTNAPTNKKKKSNKKKKKNALVDSSKGVSSVKARVSELHGKGEAIVPVNAETSL